MADAQLRVGAWAEASVNAAPTPRLWLERLALTNFRNYAANAIEAGPEPVVLLGPNGAGKTNLLEAVSLLAPGQGLRRAPFAELARVPGSGDWAVASRLNTPRGPIEIGTGQQADAAGDERSARIVRIDGATQSGSGVLADYVEMVWLTPAMDGLFTGPAGDRRRFLDRLILCFDPGYRTRIGHYERAMAQRNRALATGVEDAARLEGFERVMAETGTAIAAARAEAVAQLAATIGARRARDPNSPFPWACIAIKGMLEAGLADRPAVDVEDSYLLALARGRERDRAAGRTLEGPHRSDIVVSHGPKAVPARLSSTGEQKALLIGLVLAHAELVAERRDGAAPVLLLDEIAAHLDADRRAALLAEILRLGAQAWMTGTDAQAFAALQGKARFFEVTDGHLAAL
jgi:DNA replication and repair protein RecF